MKTLLGILVATVILVGCKPKEVVITGQVFIPTAGGANVKLGGVIVRAVPAALAKQREKDTLAAAQRDDDQAVDAHAHWRIAKVQADEAANRARLEVNSAKAEVARLERIRSQNAIAIGNVPAKQRSEAEQAMVSVIEALRQAEAKLKADKTELDRLLVLASKAAADEPAKPTEILAPVPRLASLKWPEAVAQATTDADGKFTLRAAPSDLALVAAGLRTVGTKQAELYFWRVPVPSGEQAELMLTDGNARVMTGYFSDLGKAK